MTPIITSPLNAYQLGKLSDETGTIVFRLKIDIDNLISLDGRDAFNDWVDKSLIRTDTLCLKNVVCSVVGIENDDHKIITLEITATIEEVNV